MLFKVWFLGYCFLLCAFISIFAKPTIHLNIKMKRKSFFNALLVLLTLICCQAITPIRAASGVKDSLLLAIPNLKDTERLEAIRQLTYTAEDSKTGIDYCRWLQREAAVQGNLFFQSFALGKMVEFYYPRFDSDSIFVVGQHFEAFCEEHQFFEHYFIIENILVKRYCDQEQFTLALNKAQKVYEKAKEHGDWLAISRSLMNLGTAYSEVGNPHEAIKVVGEAAKIMREKMAQGEKDVAVRLMEAYLNMVTYSENLKDYEAMLQYIDTLRVYIHQTQVERPNFNLSQYSFYASIFEAVANSKLNNLDEAQRHLREAKRLMSPAWGDNVKLLLWQARSMYHEKTGEYARALAYSDSAFRVTTQYNLGFGVKANLLQKAVLFSKMGNYQQSAQVYARLISVTDSINSARYASQISELKTIYELDKAELEAAQVRHRLQISRYFLAGAITFSVLLAVIILIVLRSRNQLRAKNLSLYRQIKEQDKLQAEQEKQRCQKSSPSKPGDELMVRLEELMRKEKLFTNPELSRRMLADRLSTNETYLFEAIRDHLGLSVSEYIALLRLNYARELLSMPAGNLTIEAVAIDSGFGSRNTFHRLFRERFGLTPTEFRRLATME